MTSLVSKLAPFFKGAAYKALPKPQFLQLNLDSFKGKNLLLFFYPLNFTFVCPTQLIALGNVVPRLNALNTQVVACSVDSKFSHYQFLQKERTKGGIKGTPITLLSDFNKKISEDYGVLSPEGYSLRGTFIIDGKQKVRFASINDTGIGRNTQEYVRLIEAIKHLDQHGEVCPANWQKGGNTIKAGLDQKVNNNYFKTVQ